MTLLSDFETKRGSWEYFLLRAAREISLSEPQYEKINARYKVLERILNAADSPLLQSAHIFVQGSIGLRTTIKPVNGAPADLGTVDADAIVWLPNAVGASAQSVLDEIHKRIEEGTRVEAKVEAPSRSQDRLRRRKPGIPYRHHACTCNLWKRRNARRRQARSA